MKFAILVLIVALSIAIVSATFSIVGLVSIFSGFPLAIIAMGIVLELGKLSSAAVLHVFWDKLKFLLKTYLVVAVIALIFLNSIGIFGFLSKNHLTFTKDIEVSSIQIQELDFQIAQQKDRIKRSQRILDNLDTAFNEYLKIQYISRALKERKKQEQERISLQSEITDASNKIAALTKQSFEHRKIIQITEANIGPIKYISELVFGEEKAKDKFDEAVRGLILLLIFVFDPLAVLLVVTSSALFKQHFEKKGQKKEKELDIKVKKQEETSEPKKVDLEEKIVEEEIEINEEEIIETGDIPLIPPHTPVMIPPPPEPKIIYKDKIVYRDRKPEVIVKTEKVEVPVYKEKVVYKDMEPKIIYKEKMVEVSTPICIEDLEPIIKDTFNEIERTSLPYSSQGVSRTFAGFSGNLGKILKRAFIKEFGEQLKKKKEKSE